MWKETSPVEQPKPSPVVGLAKPLAEDEFRTIMDRLEATRDVFRELRELKNVLSRREAETRELRSRNTELEEIMRKFAPMLLNVATTMGLAAKTQTLDSRNEL
jgi:hypothetical protein